MNKPFCPEALRRFGLPKYKVLPHPTDDSSQVVVEMSPSGCEPQILLGTVTGVFKNDPRDPDRDLSLVGTGNARQIDDKWIAFDYLPQEEKTNIINKLQHDHWLKNNANNPRMPILRSSKR